jgi:hypothetical protein
MSYLRYLCLSAYSGVQDILRYVFFCFSSFCVPYVASFSGLYTNIIGLELITNIIGPELITSIIGSELITNIISSDIDGFIVSYNFVLKHWSK